MTQSEDSPKEEAGGSLIDQRPTLIRERAARGSLGDTELTAAGIVARHTGARVYLQDDNRGPSGKPDLRVEYADGRAAVIEVVTDIDPGRAAVIQAARHDGTRPEGRQTSQSFPVAGLHRKWWVGLRDTVGLKKLRSEARPLLEQADAHLSVDRHTIRADGLPWERRLHQLGIVDLIRGSAAEPGEVWILPLGAGGSTDPDETGFLQWIKTFLAGGARADVRAKLSRGDFAERHCFILCSESTDWVVNGQLDDTTAWLPTASPELAPPISHVWLFNIEMAGRCLHYGPPDGWIDFQRPGRRPNPRQG